MTCKAEPGGATDKRGVTRESSGGPPSDRRTYGRLTGEGGICSIGHILDISAGGMRVMCHHGLRNEQQVTFAHPTRGSMTVPAKVAWCRREGWGRHAAGIEFVGINEEDRREILRSWQHSMLSNDTGPLADQRGRSGPSVLMGLGLAGVAAALGLGWAGLIPHFAPQQLIANFHDWPMLGIGAAVLLAIGLLRGLRPESVARAAAPAMEITQLRESQNMLKSLVSSSTDGVVFVRSMEAGEGGGEGFEFQLVNPAAEAFLDASSDSLIGRQVGPSTKVYGAHNLLADVQRAWQANLPVTKDVHCTTADKWVSMTLTRSGRGVLVTMTDLSEKSRSQARLPRLAA